MQHAIALLHFAAYARNRSDIDVPLRTERTDVEGLLIPAGGLGLDGDDRAQLGGYDEVRIGHFDEQSSPTLSQNRIDLVGHFDARSDHFQRTDRTGPLAFFEVAASNVIVRLVGIHAPRICGDHLAELPKGFGEI